MDPRRNINTQGAYPPAINSILARFPGTPVTTVEQPMTAEQFAKQKTKQIEYPIEGGALGIITTPEGKIILTKRSGPHTGWALPGGRVEIGEEFHDAMAREVQEETGVGVAVDGAVAIDDKVFVAPDGERLPFWLAVFHGHIIGNVQPHQTEKAIKEGLEVGTFTPDQLPEEMVPSDKAKIVSGLVLRFAQDKTSPHS